MKKRVALLFTLVFMVVMFFACGKKGGEQVTVEQVQELLARLNENPIGFRVQADPADIVIAPGEGGSLLTLKNPQVSMDMSVFKELGMPIFTEDMKFPVKAGELVFLYNPSDSYLEWVSGKDVGMKMEMNSGPQPVGLNLSAATMSFKGYEIGVLLDSKDKKPLDIFLGLMKKNSSMEAAVTGLVYDINFAEQGKSMTMAFRGESLDWKQQGSPEALMAIFSKDEKADFAVLLKESKPVFDMSGKARNLSMTVKEGGKELGGGNVADSDFIYYLKPDNKNEFFEYAFNWDMENMTISIPGKEVYESLGSVKKMNMEFAIGHLSSGLLDAYFGLVGESMGAVKSGDQEALKQAQMAQGMKIAGAFMQSQPEFKFSIKPLEHKFGRLEGHGDFAFKGMGAPTGKATVRVFDIDTVIENIKGVFPLPEETVASIGQMFKKEGADGVMVFESDGTPKGMTLNGQPIKL